ncbi:hypothetical protein LCGC14_1306090 [marine sediment metagenome]|uniref:Uncharacterized protein n=1 Tax=marine sediment metagenome TaxID=412755 RepID=A0A0F9KNS5_9ZZZZ
MDIDQDFNQEFLNAFEQGIREGKFKVTAVCNSCKEDRKRTIECNCTIKLLSCIDG